MRFDKISDTELRCHIPIEEIKKEGLEPNDLLRRDERAYNFLQDVIRRGEEETGFENNGPMSVEGTVLNNSLELVFRVLKEEDIEKFKKQFDHEQIEHAFSKRAKPVLPISLSDKAPWIEPIALVFDDLFTAYSFARRIDIKDSVVCLYKYREQYVLRYDFIGCSKEDAGRLCQLANEFACRAFFGTRDCALMTTEHGELLSSNFTAFVR